MTKEIPLTKGYVAIVDDEDYELVSCRKWRATVGRSGCVYAISYTRNADGKKSTVSMHRLLMGVTDPKINVDHISGNGLDNRRSNMRLCTRAQNAWNTGVSKISVSGVKGVSLRDGKWQSMIRVCGKRIWLGCFALKQDAAAAYEAAAIKYHGEFARL